MNVDVSMHLLRRSVRHSSVVARVFDWLSSHYSHTSRRLLRRASLSSPPEDHAVQIVGFIDDMRLAKASLDSLQRHPADAVL